MSGCGIASCAAGMTAGGAMHCAYHMITGSRYELRGPPLLQFLELARLGLAHAHAVICENLAIGLG